MLIAKIGCVTRVINNNYKKTASGTDNLEIESQKIDSGYLAVITGITATDYTTAAKRIMIQIKDGAETLTLFDETLGTGNRTAHVDCNIILAERAYVLAIIVTPTDVDVCYLAVNGYLIHRL
jgi:hypothetical protein